MAKFTGTQSDDTIHGGDDNDVIVGLAGSDTLFGGGGIDKLFGGLGADQLWGGDSRDYLNGGNGADTIYGEAGNDIVNGGFGADTVYGGFGLDYIAGEDGDDVLRGESADDTLLGGIGNDTLVGGGGVDQVDGGDGYDTVSFLDYAATQGAVIDLRTGVVANDGFGNAETVTGIEAVIGTTYADTLLGTDTANTFWGGAGDTIQGFGGTDVFYISTVQGATLDGGSGYNTLVLTGQIDSLGPDGNVVTVNSTQGMVVDLDAQQVTNDGFGASATIVGFRGAETGAGNDTIIGSSAANQLNGGAGDDTLSGGDNDDTLTGGYGADTLTGGSGNDIFSYGLAGEYLHNDGTESGDVITDFTQGEDKLDIQPSLRPLLFVGTDSLDDYQNAISYDIEDGDTYVHVKDSRGEGTFETTIKLNGVHELTASDFVAVMTEDGATPFAHGAQLHPATLYGDLASLALA